MRNNFFDKLRRRNFALFCGPDASVISIEGKDTRTVTSSELGGPFARERDRYYAAYKWIKKHLNDGILPPRIFLVLPPEVVKKKEIRKSAVSRLSEFIFIWKVIHYVPFDSFLYTALWGFDDSDIPRKRIIGYLSGSNLFLSYCFQNTSYSRSTLKLADTDGNQLELAINALEKRGGEIAFPQRYKMSVFTQSERESAIRGWEQPLENKIRIFSPDPKNEIHLAGNYQIEIRTDLQSTIGAALNSCFSLFQRA